MTQFHLYKVLEKAKSKTKVTWEKTQEIFWGNDFILYLLWCLRCMGLSFSCNS